MSMAAVQTRQLTSPVPVHPKERKRRGGVGGEGGRGDNALAAKQNVRAGLEHEPPGRMANQFGGVSRIKPFLGVTAQF